MSKFNRLLLVLNDGSANETYAKVTLLRLCLSNILFSELTELDTSFVSSPRGCEPPSFIRRHLTEVWSYSMTTGGPRSWVCWGLRNLDFYCANELDLNGLLLGYIKVTSSRLIAASLRGVLNPISILLLMKFSSKSESETSSFGISSVGLIIRGNTLFFYCLYDGDIIIYEKDF